jgi:hypothetical protein
MEKVACSQRKKNKFEKEILKLKLGYNKKAKLFMALVWFLRRMKRDNRYR